MKSFDQKIFEFLTDPKVKPQFALWVVSTILVTMVGQGIQSNMDYPTLLRHHLSNAGDSLLTALTLNLGFMGVSKLFNDIVKPRPLTSATIALALHTYRELKTSMLPGRSFDEIDMGLHIASVSLFLLLFREKKNAQLKRTKTKKQSEEPEIK